MQRLTVTASINTFSGYGQLAHELFSGLEQRGVFCSIRAIDVQEPFGSEVPMEIKSRFVHCQQCEPWELLIKNPGHLPSPGKKTAYFSMYESTVIPKEWVAIYNRAEHVIVPCKWNEVGFKKSGVTTPITVIPLGYSPEIFHYMPPRSSGPFVVGIAGRVSHGPTRKGIRRAIDIFLQTFQNILDVELHVKIHPDCDLGKPDIHDHRVKITRAHLPWFQVQKWFSNLDVFLSLATAEGFGLWQLQAMACGRPVIAVRYSGLADYMTEQNSYCLPFTEKANPDYGGGLWADITDQDVKKMLLKAYSNREEMVRKGELAAADATKFTWGKSVEKLYNLLVKIGALENDISHKNGKPK
jgi:glycosyltransferase involved in cell wall biosynthesis